MLIIPGYNPSGPDFELFTIGESGQQAKPADINLLATTLDSRITYSGGRRAYRNASGGLTLASANEWPLEYAGGVPVGRHEPEPAATNVITDNRFATIGTPNQDKAWYSTGSGTRAVVADKAIDGGAAFQISSTYNAGAVYNGSAFAIAQTTAFTDTALDNGWKFKRLKGNFAINPTAARFYPARLDANNYLYFTNSAVSGNFVMSEIRKINGDSTDFVCLPQVEYGTIATSPILTGVTRDENTVSVSKDGSAKGITIYFTDGTSKDYDFGSASKITIAKSANDWATRYATKISYRV